MERRGTVVRVHWVGLDCMLGLLGPIEGSDRCRKNFCGGLSRLFDVTMLSSGRLHLCHVFSRVDQPMLCFLKGGPAYAMMGQCLLGFRCICRRSVSGASFLSHGMLA